jgi:hypothetical protein
MTSERVRAYKRVVTTLRELGPSKLLPREQDRIREAADQLIFAHDLLTDEAARAALLEVDRLCRDLVESRRWQHHYAMRLADDLCACGPHVSAELLVA